MSRAARNLIGILVVQFAISSAAIASKASDLALEKFWTFRTNAEATKPLVGALRKRPRAADADSSSRDTSRIALIRRLVYPPKVTAASYRDLTMIHAQYPAQGSLADALFEIIEDSRNTQELVLAAIEALPYFASFTAENTAKITNLIETFEARALANDWGGQHSSRAAILRLIYWKITRSRITTAAEDSSLTAFDADMNAAFSVKNLRALQGYYELLEDLAMTNPSGTFHRLARAQLTKINTELAEAKERKSLLAPLLRAFMYQKMILVQIDVNELLPSTCEAILSAMGTGAREIFVDGKLYRLLR